MANALTDFTKKREFLICMDSDGCVMDTVRIKHSTVMCPELIRVFALDDHADFITAAWDEINLHTITRGISRFESVRLVFDRLKNRGIEIPGSEDIAAWVDTATELSTASLQRELQKTGSLALRKLQEWNNACNRRIQALEPTFEPFPGVEESLRQLHAVADVAVVSAANESAIASEFVISRAGANAICELNALKKPNLLIPLSANASRGDQILNARSFERQGFSMVLEEEEITESTLLNAIRELYQNRESYVHAMSESSHMNSIEKITGLIEDCVNKQ